MLHLTMPVSGRTNRCPWKPGAAHEKHWSHRLLDTADAIVDALCRAWNALAAERLRSLTSYPYLEQVKI
jgi:hypothetical protein